MVSPGHSSDYADQEDSFLQSPVRRVVAVCFYYRVQNTKICKRYFFFAFCFFSVIVVKGTIDPKRQRNN